MNRLEPAMGTVQRPAAAAGQPHEQRREQRQEDAPMTPVVYVVLWTSVAVGCLRGYAVNASTAARAAPSYTSTFRPQHPMPVVRQDSLFCTNGVDGLPGVSWYEGLIGTVPGVVAPVLAALFIQRFGRRAGLMLGCVLSIIGLVLLASAHHLVQLYIGQACVGPAADVLFFVIALQDIEIAPRSSRGFFLVVHVLGYALGSCTVAVIGYLVATQASLGWRLLFAMGTLPAMAVLVITPWLYETPQSFIERGRYAKGWEALREIRGPFYTETYTEFMSIVRAAAAAPKGLKMWKELFCNRCHTPAITLGVIMSLLAVLLDPLSRTYVAYQSLTRSGMPFGHAVLMTSVTLYGSFAVGSLIAVLLVDRVGRVPLLRASSVIAVVSILAMIIVASSHGVRLTPHPTPSRAVIPRSWALMQLANLAVLAAGNGLAWFSTAWLIIFESQALAVRSAAVAVCLSVANLGSSVVEARLLCFMKVTFYFFVLACSLVALIISFGFVPETSKVSLEDISALYEQHWWWSRVLNTKKWPHRRWWGLLRGRDERSKLPKTDSRLPRAGKDCQAAPQAGGSGDTPDGGSGGPKQVLPVPSGGAAAKAAGALQGLPAPAGPVDLQQGPDTAAVSDARHSPFEQKDVQLDMAAQAAAAAAAADDPQAAAEAAAAAALAGASSNAAASLQHGWSNSRRTSLRPGRHRSVQGPEPTGSNALDQLADELRGDD